jgi:MoaA/NifB/PqqE/SkfB family radical SAM enzyme
MWQQAFELGAIHINLTGGEPLMRNIDELSTIIKSLLPKKTLISLVTNSLLVTKEKLAKLKNAGLDTLQLSIESVNPEKNDELRGVKGTFAKTMEALKYAKELGLNVCLSAVICHGNKEEIEKLLAFAKKENVFLLLNVASSVGRWQGRNDKKMIEEDVNVFDGFMKDEYVRNGTSFNFSGKRECPGGKERIHITAYGDVMTCPLVQVSYGNILEEPLKDIFNRMNSFAFIKKHNRVCKHSFDKEYYEKICKPAEQVSNPPLSIFDHPNIDINNKNFKK